MVNLNEITEVLKKLKSNKDKLNYLKKLLDEVDDKELRKNIKNIIEDILELEAVSQIEIRGKVDWSLPEEEKQPREERRLERQVISIPSSRREENKSEVKYGISHSDITYMHDKIGGNYIRSKIMDSLRNENLIFDENLPIMEDQKDLIEGRVRKYMPTSHEETIQRETASIIRSFQYESQHQQSRGYASLSDELHDKERRRHRH